MAKLGILVLGQTPRPDIEGIYRHHLPAAELLIGGGLDGMSMAQIDALVEATPEYPLFVPLADGSTREISMFRLIPLLEQKAAELAAAGAEVIVLMCAGNFPDLKSPLPVIYPGRVVPALVTGLSARKNIGIISPNAGQLEPACRHWREKGFKVAGEVAAPIDMEALQRAATAFKDSGVDLVVLDCMGFKPAAVEVFKSVCNLPVICPQRLVARVTAEMLGC